MLQASAVAVTSLASAVGAGSEYRCLVSSHLYPLRGSVACPGCYGVRPRASPFVLVALVYVALEDQV